MPGEALLRALQVANAAVLQRASALGAVGNSGTTLAAAVIHDGGLHWASVGDTRVYLHRAGRLTQLTVDHGYERILNRQVAAGDISAEAAADHPERRALTSYLGLDTVTEIDRTVKPLPLQPGDRVVLCTDGVHGVIAAEDIGRVLDEHSSGAAQALVDAVLARRRTTQDNATVTLMDFGLRARANPDLRRSPGAARRSRSRAIAAALAFVVRGDHHATRS